VIPQEVVPFGAGARLDRWSVSEATMGAGEVVVVHPGGWPTFAVSVLAKVGTHTARAGVFDLCFHSLTRTAAEDVDFESSNQVITCDDLVFCLSGIFCQAPQKGIAAVNH
jgi:hypothetical protein